MVVGITEISVLILAAVAAFLLYKVLKTATSLAINAVLGILSLIVVSFCWDLRSQLHGWQSLSVQLEEFSEHL